MLPLQPQILLARLRLVGMSLFGYLKRLRWERGCRGLGPRMRCRCRGGPFLRFLCLEVGGLEGCMEVMEVMSEASVEWEVCLKWRWVVILFVLLDGMPV